MAVLRNEDYIGFLDESGESGLTVVSGVLIPARWLRPAERRWRAFINYGLGSRSGRREIKSRDLIAGTRVAYQAQSATQARTGNAISAGAAGRVFYTEALEHIGTIAEVRILTVGLPTNHSVQAYRAWFWLAYACLVGRSNERRPRLAMAVIDGQDASFREAQDLIAYRFHKSFRGVQPYVQAGNAWFIGGSVHQESELHPFIQMADLVAGAGRHAIAQRAQLASWYDRHLRQPALEMHREIDVSHHALSEIQRLDAWDRCGSGYPQILVVP